jgi:hypothetical protein
VSILVLTCDSHAEYGTFVKFLDESNSADWIALKNYCKIIESKIKQEDIEFPNISIEGKLQGLSCWK